MARRIVRAGPGLQATLDGIAVRLTKAKTLRVGFLEGATYPDGTSVPLVAAINEYGAPSRGQPPRPYFRTMVKDKSPGWPAAVAANLKAADMDAGAALARVGEGIKSQLQQSIVDLTSPPLKPSTIKAKGFDKPLIDSSHLLNSADYEVE